jgi:hypothetical protein
MTAGDEGRAYTTVPYACDRCGFESYVQAVTHRPRLCTRTNCGGMQSPADEGRACMEPAPDRSGRRCDKPKGHDGHHWTYGWVTFTWAGRVHPDGLIHTCPKCGPECSC